MEEKELKNQAEKNQTTSPTKAGPDPGPARLRLFADTEETWRVVRPSVRAFEAIRGLALRSSKIPLARKFELCTELALDWRVELNIEGRKDLDKILANIKTDDPGALGEKVLAARGIKERFNDATLSALEVARQAAPFLFADDNGQPPAISDDSVDDLLIGNIEKAMGLVFGQINIREGEDLSGRMSFRVFVDSDDEYPLAPVSVRNLRRLAELQVLTLSIPEQDRRQVCDEMVWDYDSETPEIADSVSKAEYWRLAATIVLDGVTPDTKNRDTIDAGEVNRALAVFFAKSDGFY